jgi:hypothetical protein
MDYSRVGFFYEYRGTISYVLGLLSGGILFSLNVPKLWKENKKLKLELERMEQDRQAREREMELKGLVEAMIICATYAKQRLRTMNVVFNEKDLRFYLGPVHQDKVFAVINALKEQGRATDTNAPGEWAIT